VIIPMARLVAEFGVTPKSILHVGAHLAEEAAAYQEAGVDRVLWVEANPELMGTLRDNVGHYPGQRVLQAAVSDTDGATATLHLCTFTMASSLLAPKEHLITYPGMPYPRSLEVETVTIDTLLAREGYGLGGFDFLNIDIEGAELLAFAGAEKTLPFLKWIYLEVNTREMYEGCAMSDEVDAYLGERGFARVVDADEGWDHGFKDALFVRHGWEVTPPDA
jgi:FkbM family methyltransferase